MALPLMAIAGLALKFLPTILTLLGAKNAAQAASGVLDQIHQKDMSESEAEVKLAEVLANAEKEIAESQAEVVKAEISGDSWLQRTWRPVVALSAFFSYLYVIIIYPHLVAFGHMPSLGFGEVGLQNLFYLTTICVGGYIGSRGLEKVVRNWRK